jgi:hypothetical protein
MKSVHLLESNSPGITAECGKWVGVSDVVKGAGSAVRWSSLNWKFSVKNEENILANVASNSKLIGNASISMAEIVEAQLKPNGMKEVVKHINNGKEITGKIKFINISVYLVDCSNRHITFHQIIAMEVYRRLWLGMSMIFSVFILPSIETHRSK